MRTIYGNSITVCGNPSIYIDTTYTSYAIGSAPTAALMLQATITEVAV